MRIFAVLCTAILITACVGPRGGAPDRGPDLRGQYQRPVYLQPEPTQRFPGDDICRSRLYLGLIGQHEGGILFASLPGRTRVVKPAETEVDQDDFLQDMQPQPPFVEIREYLAGQILYSPAIRAVRLGDELGPVEQDRLTIELDQYGYVNQLSCR
jgi:hypothetical protein